MSSDIRTSSIVLKVLYGLLVLYLKGMSNSELLDVDNSACRSHTNEFGAKFIPPCSGRAVGLKSDNDYSKINAYDYYIGSITYRQ